MIITIIIIIIQILSCRECFSVMDEERDCFEIIYTLYTAICTWLLLIVSMIFKCSDLACINFNKFQSHV